MKTLNIEAKVDNLSKVLSFIDEELDKSDCSIKAEMQINIAVEELFVNVAHYAYAPGTGDISISIDFTDDPAAAVITLTDTGIPYNPVLKKDPDIGLSAEEREVGGLGIYMVKKSMDLLTYEHKDGRNIVTIIKYI